MAVILPSVYKDGTATVAANGVAVTGQGTMWLNTVLPGDFFGTHKGAPNRILAVNSNTSLTLAYPWLGGAQAAAAYEIMYQSDNARMLEATRQLLEKLSGGNVDAFSGLAGVADRIPYFTGVGTMGLASLTGFARSLLGGANAESVYGTLGVIPNNQLPDRIKNSPNVAAITDCNAVTETGWYRVAAADPNSPENATMLLMHIAWTSTQARQIIMRHSSNNMYERANVGGAWTAWTRMWTERGSNANGEYVRHPDGTQMCWANNLSVTATSVYTATSTWTLPAPFSGSIYAGVCNLRAVNATSADSMRDSVPLFAPTDASSAVFGLSSNARMTVGATAALRVIAIGRWF